MKALIISQKFHPGHVSHLVASYKQCQELGYDASFYVNKGFVSFLPKNSCIQVIGEGKTPIADLAVFTFPHPKNILLMRRLKRKGSCKIVFIFHEPLTKLKVYKDAGFSKMQLMKLWIGDYLESIVTRIADVIILPSRKAVQYYEANNKYRNTHTAYIPLMYDDERENRHTKLKRTSFSYIGTVASDHSFREYLDFVIWAIKENKLPDVQFLIATKSEFEVPEELKNSSRVSIQKGRPLSDEEINAYYASTYVVWNAYERTTQSGVLAKSFMFGTPALVLKKNLNEFTSDGIEVRAIVDNQNKEEICEAVEDIIGNFDSYSTNCRNRFVNSFYYRKYNKMFKDMISDEPLVIDDRYMTGGGKYLVFNYLYSVPAVV